MTQSVESAPVLIVQFSLQRRVLQHHRFFIKLYFKTLIVLYTICSLNSGKFIDLRSRQPNIFSVHILTRVFRRTFFFWIIYQTDLGSHRFSYCLVSWMFQECFEDCNFRTFYRFIILVIVIASRDNCFYTIVDWYFLFLKF